MGDLSCGTGLSAKGGHPPGSAPYGWFIQLISGSSSTMLGGQPSHGVSGFTIADSADCARGLQQVAFAADSCEASRKNSVGLYGYGS